MRFAADATLGKLGRHLRAAGFDTRCQHQCRQADFWATIDTGRIILTRSTVLVQRFQDRHLIFIRDNDPLRQMIQVVRELGIGPGDGKPFSRCLACNRVIDPMDRQAAIGRVPAYVWQRHSRFHSCARCRRVYWAGSHHDRMREWLSKIFQP